MDLIHLFKHRQPGSPMSRCRPRSRNNVRRGCVTPMVNRTAASRDNPSFQTISSGFPYDLMLSEINFEFPGFSLILRCSQSLVASPSAICSNSNCFYLKISARISQKKLRMSLPTSRDRWMWSWPRSFAMSHRNDELTRHVLIIQAENSAKAGQRRSEVMIKLLRMKCSNVRRSLCPYTRLHHYDQNWYRNFVSLYGLLPLNLGIALR